MDLYPPSTIIPIYVVLMAVGVLLTGLRLWVRLCYTRMSIGADDVFMVLGTTVMTACTAIQIYNATSGLAGAAASTVLSDKQQQARAILEYQIDFAMLVIEKVAFGTIKLSLLFFYRRIFGVWPSFSRWNNALIVLVAAWMLAFIGADLFLCGGDRVWLQFSLDQMRARRECGDKGALLIAFAASSVVTDVFVLGLPLAYLRRLQMPRTKRAAASFVFLLGTV